jgi:O-antigen/teichoic acid export membrane protein
MTELSLLGARRIQTDIAVQIAARIVNLALGVVVTLILVRSLGSRGFGVWSSLFAITQLATSFGELGLGQIAVSRAAAEPERESQWLGALVSLRMILAVPITLLSLLGVLLIAPTASARVAGALLSLTLLVGAPTSINSAFQLRVRNDLTMATITVNSVLWGLGVGVVALSSGGIVAFAVAFVTTAVTTTLLTVALARRLVSITFHGVRALWPTMLRVGLVVGIGGILVTSYVRLDQILVLEFAGARQAGLYAAAYRVLDQIQFIPAAVMTTLFPLIAAARAAQQHRVPELLQTAGEYLAMASLPILAFTIVAAKPIVVTLFGAQFAEASRALPILAGAFVSISSGYLVGSMVIVLGLQNRFIRYAAIGLVLNAGLNVLLIPPFGFVAAAWITLVTEFTVMLLSMRAVVRTLHMRPRLGRVLRTLLAATIMGVAAALAGRSLPLGLVALVAALVYFPALLLTGALVPGDVKRVLESR